jgi:hypothetical protein
MIPVRLSDKGQWMDRKKFSAEQLEETAVRIRNALEN